MSMKSACIMRVRHRAAGFTLAELLVSIAVVVIITLIASQLMTSATAITRTGNKHFDTDTQARVVLDRMALDFAKMVKRTDMDYYIKQPNKYNGHGNGHGCGQGRNGDKGSDQIAFYSQVPGYYASTTAAEQSPISLIAYRVNEGSNASDRYGKLERMAKGLLWNGVENTTGNSAKYPIVFTTGQFPSSTQGSCPYAGTTGFWAVQPNQGGWSAAICNDNGQWSQDNDYEVLGPGVFRFEYYYLLKNGRVTDWPWDRFDYPTQQTIYSPVALGLTQIRAIAVSVAVIDPASRALIQQAAAANPTTYGDILDLGAELPDFKNSCGQGNGQRAIGSLELQWKGILDSVARTGQTPQGKKIPAEAAKGIRVYNRYFDLKTW
jgi:prepilin-type N-terminal cleavage/methylation domain-containing protein